MPKIYYDDVNGGTYTYPSQSYVPRVGDTVILKERRDGERIFEVIEVLWSADDDNAKVKMKSTDNEPFSPPPQLRLPSSTGHES
ncbi:MAG: hypothetical protein WDO74_04680 [Pseudomonadota bacterium]